MTTIIGIKTKQGVYLAADRKVCNGHLKVAEERKIVNISGTIWVAATGGVGAVQIMGKRCTRYIQIQKLLADSKTLDFTPEEFCNHLAEMNFDYLLEYPWSFEPYAFIVAGLDKEEEPVLYCAEYDGSTIEHKNVIAHGSGREPALAILKQSYSPDLSKKEALALCVNAVLASVESDVFSGGDIMDIVFIGKDGTIEPYEQLLMIEATEPEESKERKEKTTAKNRQRHRRTNII